MSDKPEFVYVTYISTTPEKVWNALLDGELTKLYWGVHKNVSDWQVGSRWEQQDYDTGVVKVEGEVLEFDPPKKLSLTWKSQLAAAPSRVTITLEPFMGAVKLTVVHGEMEPGSPLWKGISQGWPAILSSLKSLMETGAPLMMTTQRWGGPPPKTS
jgi:uncharacterized protein YndB with AHSA1/START domain